MSLPPAYFDRLYRRAEDPWSFRTRWYERRKRAVTMAALTADRYGSVFEPGCSIGLLTAELATRADRVLAMDPSAVALERAAGIVPESVQLVRGAVPADWPNGRFDLVILSELGYYLEPAECAVLADAAFGSAAEVVAVHWRHPVEDYPMSGDEVHASLTDGAERACLALLVSHVEADFRLDVWCQDPRSVAARTALPGVGP
jgi:SAM-dependent methyltransferase